MEQGPWAYQVREPFYQQFGEDLLGIGKGPSENCSFGDSKFGFIPLHTFEECLCVWVEWFEMVVSRWLPTCVLHGRV